MKKCKNIFESFLIFILSFSFATIVSACSNNIEEKIDVSVIVPIYNVEKYLDECLDSIENQTKTDNVEIICINDGSTDNSPEILKRHADKNNKIKVITQENQGLSGARNSGMKIAKGKYIMFVDSDDLILPYAIEQAYNTAEKYNSDIVSFNRICFYDGSNIDLNSYKYDSSKVSLLKRNKNQNPFEVWDKCNIQGSVCWRFWKRDFIEINKLTFKENAKFEDLLFMWLSIPRLSEITVNENPIYAYRMARKNSIMYNLNRNTQERLNNYLVIIEELIKNRDCIEFDNINNWIVETILFRCYNNVLRLESQKVHYSERVLSLIDEFIKKYNVNVSKENMNKINNLLKLSKNI